MSEFTFSIVSNPFFPKEKSRDLHERRRRKKKRERKRKERRDSRMHQSRETRRFNVRVENSSWRTHTHTRFLSEGHHFFSLALLFLLFQERRKENQNMRFLLDRGERGEIYADVETQGEALSVLSHRLIGKLDGLECGNFHSTCL